VPGTARPRRANPTPRILMALWLFATIDGRRQRPPPWVGPVPRTTLAYQWLCGGRQFELSHPEEGPDFPAANTEQPLSSTKLLTDSVATMFARET